MKAWPPSSTALVLGGGVIGLFSALALHRAGFQVHLLERGSIGRQASWAGGGILSPLYPWRAPGPVWDLAAESVRRYPVIAAELAVSTGVDPEWTPSGMWVFDTEDMAEARAWSAGSGFGVERDCWEGQGRLGGTPALWLPWVAQIRNPRLCRALKCVAESSGVVCEEARGELKLVTVGDKAQLQDGAGERRAADVIVVAAGAWSGELLAAVGWPLPIRPVKGQMILLRGPPGLLPHMILQGSRYLIPRRDGRILVGSTVEPEAGFDTSVTESARDQLMEFAGDFFSAGVPLELEAHWAGVRPGSPNECPVIGRHPSLTNLFVNTGHYRNGLTLAPASADRLVRQIVGAD